MAVKQTETRHYFPLATKNLNTNRGHLLRQKGRARERVRKKRGAAEGKQVGTSVMEGIPRQTQKGKLRGQKCLSGLVFMAKDLRNSSELGRVCCEYVCTEGPDPIAMRAGLISLIRPIAVLLGVPSCSH